MCVRVGRGVSSEGPDPQQVLLEALEALVALLLAAVLWGRRPGT